MAPSPWPGPGHPKQALPEGHRTAAAGGDQGRSPHPTLLFWQDILEQAAQGSVQLGLEGCNTSKGAGGTNSPWLPLPHGLHREVFRHLIFPAYVWVLSMKFRLLTESDQWISL